MTRMKIVNPLTGEVIEKPIKMRWTRSAGLLMTAMVLGVGCCSYLSYVLWGTDETGMSGLFALYAAVLTVTSYRVYKAVRLSSNLYGQYLATIEEAAKESH